MISCAIFLKGDPGKYRGIGINGQSLTFCEGSTKGFSSDFGNGTLISIIHSFQI